MFSLLLTPRPMTVHELYWRRLNLRGHDLSSCLQHNRVHNRKLQLTGPQQLRCRYAVNCTNCLRFFVTRKRCVCLCTAGLTVSINVFLLLLCVSLGSQEAAGDNCVSCTVMSTR